MTCRKSSSRPGRLGNINPIPIGYGFRPHLRGPANPARINLAQEPLDFRREGFSPSLTLLMSAFALPIPPASLTARLHRPTERSATASEDRNQESGIRTVAREALQHAGNLAILALPTPGHILVDVSQIAAIERPNLHLVGRADRHHHKATKLDTRLTLLAKPLGNVGADRLRRPPDLVGQGELLDPWEVEACPMDLQR